jgi:hypothetical protein
MELIKSIQSSTTIKHELRLNGKYISGYNHSDDDLMERLAKAESQIRGQLVELADPKISDWYRKACLDHLRFWRGEFARQYLALCYRTDPRYAKRITRN